MPPLRLETCDPERAAVDEHSHWVAAVVDRADDIVAAAHPELADLAVAILAEFATDLLERQDPTLRGSLIPDVPVLRRRRPSPGLLMCAIRRLGIGSVRRWGAGNRWRTKAGNRRRTKAGSSRHRIRAQRTQVGRTVQSASVPAVAILVMVRPRLLVIMASSSGLDCRRSGWTRLEAGDAVGSLTTVFSEFRSGWVTGLAVAGAPLDLSSGLCWPGAGDAEENFLSNMRKSLSFVATIYCRL